MIARMLDDRKDRHITTAVVIQIMVILLRFEMSCMITARVNLRSKLMIEALTYDSLK